MSGIPSFDYLAQYGELRDEIHSAIDRVLASGQLILGPEVERFEESFAAYLESGECVGVASGTDAIVVGLRALSVGDGDEVVTVANTAVPTVSAIRLAGATPVFCDVDEKTSLMNLERVEECLTDHTRAIIPVHLYGNAVDISQLYEIIGSRDIRVIEDCAHAHGAELRGRKVGTFGDVGAFSFYPTKNLGAFGDAGLCASADPELVARMRRISQYGFDSKGQVEHEGLNSRLDEIQAAILNVKLVHLPRFLGRRRSIAALYDRLLEGSGVEPIGYTKEVLHAYHLYVVRARNRDALRSRLEERDIETGIHYPRPIHRMNGYAFLGYEAGSLPVTEALATTIVSLPMYPELTDENVIRVATSIVEWSGG